MWGYFEWIYVHAHWQYQLSGNWFPAINLFMKYVHIWLSSTVLFHDLSDQCCGLKLALDDHRLHGDSNFKQDLQGCMSISYWSKYFYWFFRVFLFQIMLKDWQVSFNFNIEAQNRLNIPFYLPPANRPGMGDYKMPNVHPPVHASVRSLVLGQSSQSPILSLAGSPIIEDRYK